MSRQTTFVKLPQSKGNRGKVWEAQLDRLMYRYNQRPGVHIWRNPVPVRRIRTLAEKGRFVACYERPALPDYGGLVDGVGLMAEAKSCTAARWPFEDLRPQQAEVFDRHLRAGGEALLFLCQAGAERGHVLPWVQVRRLWYAWRMPWQRGERAAPGTRSIPWSVIESRSIYSAALPRFDFLEPLQRWLQLVALDRQQAAAQLRAEQPPQLTANTRQGEKAWR